MTELERIEFEFMKAQLTAALSRIAALESAPSSGGGGGDGGVARQPEYIDLDTDYPVKPFTIERDDEAETDGNYKMYVPDGCVLYDGVAVSVSGKGDDGWLDLGTTEGVTYYLHITKDSSGNKVATISTDGADDDDLATVKVATIATEDEGSEQFLFSAINLGGSGSGQSLDEMSIDVNYDDEVELFGWCDDNANADPTLAVMMADTGSYGDLPYRPENYDNSPLEYHKLGKIRTVDRSGLSMSAVTDDTSDDYGNALIDLADREESDNFGIHEIKSGSGSSATTLAKFLGTADVEMTGGSGGTVTGNKTDSVAVSGVLTVVGGVTTTGEESNVQVLTTDTTADGVASGTIQIGVYYV